MHIFDIDTKEHWNDLLTRFSEENGMPGALFDSENKILLTAGNRNSFCNNIRKNNQSLATVCSAAQSNMALMAKKTEAPVIDFCDANCIKVVIPCFYENEYLGGITSCGCSVPEEDLNLEFIAMILNTSIEELQKSDVKTADQEQLKQTARKYHRLVDAMRYAETVE